MSDFENAMQETIDNFYEAMPAKDIIIEDHNTGLDYLAKTFVAFDSDQEFGTDQIKTVARFEVNKTDLGYVPKYKDNIYYDGVKYMIENIDESDFSRYIINTRTDLRKNITP